MAKRPHSSESSPAVTAWAALRGELEGDPAEVVGRAANDVAEKLSAIGPHQTTVAIREAQWLLGMVAEIFGFSDLPADDEARLFFKAELRQRRGRPVDRERFRREAFRGRSEAKEVEALIAAGDRQKVAVGKVAKRTGQSDAVIAGYVRKWRDYPSWLKKHF